MLSEYCSHDQPKDHKLSFDYHDRSPDETQNLRYKLVTLDRSIIGQVNVIPTVSVGGTTSLTLTAGRNEVATLRPTTTATQAFVFDAPPFGYTAILYNRDAVTVTATAIPGVSSTAVTPFFTNTLSGNAFVIKGMEFTITPNDVDTITNTQLTIVGNQSGATITIPITVNPSTN